jgi:hypothetical protein
MFKSPRLVVLFSAFLLPTVLSAQSLCPSGVASPKLVCAISQVYGPNGLVLDNTNAQALGVSPFQDSLPQTLRPLNASIARQAALLPLASPSSGITFSWDPALHVFQSTTDSYGPILGERAETIGRYKLFVGLAYQYFKFDSLDGVKLNNLPAVFTQPDTFASQVNGGTTCSLAGDSSTSQNQCGFIRDIITTRNSIDLKLHQFTTFVTFGITNRIDVSMAIPIQNVRMGISSTATIVNLSASNPNLHQFPSTPGCSLPCVQTSGSAFRTASGIGDIIFRVKGSAWKGEKSAVAIGVDVRVPTGDSLNFLGAGAAGFKPFAVWSYHARVSPHASVGYEVNGSSKIAGDINLGTKDRLPGELTYAAGADVWITKRLSGAFDFVGQQVFSAPRLSRSTFTVPQACADSPCDNGLTAPSFPTAPDLSSTSSSYNVANASVGVKFRPFGHVLVTGNVLVKLNDSGLRATAVPLIGVSYTF